MKRIKRSGKETKMEKKLEIGGGTEQYLKPEMEVIKFENEDVIVTSCYPVYVPDYDDWLG